MKQTITRRQVIQGVTTFRNHQRVDVYGANGEKIDITNKKYKIGGDNYDQAQFVGFEDENIPYRDFEIEEKEVKMSELDPSEATPTRGIR